RRGDAFLPERSADRRGRRPGLRARALRDLARPAHGCPGAAQRPDAPPVTPLRLPGLAAYGALRMPLALLELPLFVLLPAFYSQKFGMELALIGAILFGTRLLDALADPFIGAAIDRSRSPAGRWAYRHWLWASLPALAVGFWAMFSPPVQGNLLAVWLALASVLTYLAYSTASIAYQAWGAQLGSTERDRARVTGIREAFGLVGVVAASALLAP